MQKDPIGIVGAGMMGTQIAALATSCGYAVRIFDIAPPVPIEKRIRRCQRLLRRSTAMKPYLASEPSSVHVAAKLSDLATSAIIFECVAEDLDTKSEVLEQISSFAHKETIIGTNTSSLKLGTLAPCVKSKNCFLGVHFFNPIHAVELVELCALPDTDSASLNDMQTFLNSLGRTVVAVPDSPGFIVNRLLFLMISSAARMVDEHGISPAVVDTAMKAGTNMPMGPLELADLIGLDICSNILQSLERQTGDAAYATPECIAECVSKGHFGKKTGAGLYQREVSI